MEALREKNGNMLLAISATGKTIRRTVSASSFIKTATSMRVSGREIRDMDRELTGETKVVNLEENTLEIGLKIRNMVEELSSTKMETVMMVIGWLECLKEKVV